MSLSESVCEGIRPPRGSWLVSSTRRVLTPAGYISSRIHLHERLPDAFLTPPVAFDELAAGRLAPGLGDFEAQPAGLRGDPPAVMADAFHDHAARRVDGVHGQTMRARA